jgi:hypothetical protein
MMRTLFVMVFSLLSLVAPALATDLPTRLYSKTSGSCQMGDVSFSAITFTGASTAGATDVFLYLSQAGKASVAFTVHDSGAIFKIVSTSWKSIDSNTVSVQGLGNLSFGMDPSDPTKFAFMSFAVLKNDFYPSLPVSEPHRAYPAFEAVDVKWDDQGQTVAEFCSH